MIRDVFMRFPGGAAKVFTLSYDDGIIYDRPLVEMFNKYHVKGTFNLNSDGIIKAGLDLIGKARRRGFFACLFKAAGVCAHISDLRA